MENGENYTNPGNLNPVSLGTAVSSTNKTDPYDITEILLKVALKTINININQFAGKQYLLSW
jgi:hypothetical protein